MNEPIEVWRSSPGHAAVVDIGSLSALQSMFRGQINIVLCGNDNRIVVYADNSAIQYLLWLFCVHKFNRLKSEHVPLSEVV